MKGNFSNQKKQKGKGKEKKRKEKRKKGGGAVISESWKDIEKREVYQGFPSLYNVVRQ
jgi:hypothetical protein